MVLAWLVTLPASAIVGGVMWWIGNLIGGLAGALVIFVILVGLAIFMYLRSRRKPVDATNVNDEWDDVPDDRARPRRRELRGGHTTCTTLDLRSRAPGRS